MAGLVPAIHAFVTRKKRVDAQDIGERSDAVLRAAMPGRDGGVRGERGLPRSRYWLMCAVFTACLNIACSALLMAAGVVAV